MSDHGEQADEEPVQGQSAVSQTPSMLHTGEGSTRKHRARYAWQALQQSTVKFDPQRFGCAFQNYAELAYELRVWPFVHSTKRVWVRV